LFFESQVGTLTEALSGRSWDRAAIAEQFLRRRSHYQRAGVRAGDRVFIYFGNNLEFFADLLALWHLGACAVPIDTRLTVFEVETLAKAVSPRFLLYLDEIDPALAAALGAGVELLDSTEAEASSLPTRPPEPALALDDDALILFTSGSTGNPKGVVHTHRSLRSRWAILRHILGIDAFRRTLCLLPTHFGHGLVSNSLYPWLSGQDLVIAPAGSVDAAMRLGALVDRHAITFMSSVPPIWHAAIKASRPPAGGSLQRIFCGSAPLSAHLWKCIREWSGTRDVRNVYGITETASWAAGTTVGDFEPEDGLLGVPWGGVIKIMKDGSTAQPPGFGEERRAGEPGFVWVNTPALMRGYFGRDDLTRAAVSNGWFTTGDIGVIDERGRLYLRGREREEINRGGTKIYPGDLEAVAQQLDGVPDACCFAVEDPHYGQAVGLAVVLAEPREDNLRALYAAMKERLAAFQMPSRWYVVETIPRSSRGKINRAAVAAECSRRRPVDVGRYQESTT
jgi:acyl-CoA synthetase (AMP-forming)/AMP-acid ligase II